MVPNTFYKYSEEAKKELNKIRRGLTELVQLYFEMKSSI